MSLLRKVISGSERAYRWLLRLYPKEFRSQYGPEMIQVFRDRCRDELEGRSRCRVVVFWGSTLVDLVTTVPLEYVKRSERMNALEKDLRWDVHYGFQMLFKHSMIMMKFAMWGFAGLLSLGVLLFLVVLAGSFPLFWHKQVPLDNAWRQTVGQTPREAYRSMMSRLPKTARNETAAKLEMLTTRLGIFHPMPFRVYPGLDTWSSGIRRSFHVAPYIYDQYKRPSDEIDKTPEEIRHYLTIHADDLADLYALIRHGEVPRWEMDVSLLVKAPVPGLTYHRELHDLIAADILEKTTLGKHQEALEAFEASWRINQSIRERPELISQLIALSLLNTQMAILRKMKGAPPEWQQRLADLDLRDRMVRSLEFDALVLAEYLGQSDVGEYLGFLETSFETKGNSLWGGNRIILSPVGWPIRRLWGTELLEATAKAVAQMKAVDWCSVDPDSAQDEIEASFSRWTPVRINFFAIWKALAESMANLELTREVLEIKYAQSIAKNNEDLQTASLKSSLCHGVQWIHHASAEGVVISPTGLPDWIVGAKTLPKSPPLTYILKRGSQLNRYTSDTGSSFSVPARPPLHSTKANDQDECLAFESSISGRL